MGTCHACTLFICSVCGCAEVTLPTECPGYEVNDDIQYDVRTGIVDFKDGAWRHKRLPGD